MVVSFGAVIFALPMVFVLEPTLVWLPLKNKREITSSWTRAGPLSFVVQV